MKKLHVPAYTPQRRGTYSTDNSPFTSGSVETTYTTGHKRRTDNTSLIFQLQKLMRNNKKYLLHYFIQRLQCSNLSRRKHPYVRGVGLLNRLAARRKKLAFHVLKQIFKRKLMISKSHKKPSKPRGTYARLYLKMYFKLWKYKVNELKVLLQDDKQRVLYYDKQKNTIQRRLYFARDFRILFYLIIKQSCMPIRSDQL